VTGETTGFQRARSEEQREVRRQAILATAADMLGEMPVAKLSLNELSRRVGLAKSNVLRYFETREAVLLELLDSAERAWLDRVEAALTATVDRDTPVGTRYERIAGVITDTLVADPLLCELISVSAGVLEHNISPDVARRYKVTSMANIDRLSTGVRACLPELSGQGAFHFSAGTLLSTGGIWPQTHPSDAMMCVYEDPAMDALRIDFAGALREMLATLLAGCLVRWPAGAVGRPGAIGLPDRSGGTA
jgi:AcrR family transcriptional regulator